MDEVSGALPGLDVPAILGFGFIGLAFLMLVLGYLLMRKVVAQDRAPPHIVGMCKFFLITALLFMIAAGPLQWFTMYMQSQMDHPSITVRIALHERDWDPAFGNIEIQRLPGGEFKTLSEAVQEEFRHNQQLNISLIQVQDMITSLLREAHPPTSSAMPESRAALEGG